MDARGALHELLLRGLLELRAAAWEETLTNRQVIVLTNLLHNLPGTLERANGAEDFERALQETWVRSREQPGAHAWVAHHLADMGFNSDRFEDTDPLSR